MRRILSTLNINSGVQWVLVTGITLFFCISCGGEKIPDSVIPRKLMPSVLLDIHLVDGQLASLPIDSARIYRDAYYGIVFDRYGIDSTAFSRSIEFYSSRPYLMNEMYSDVEKKLQTLTLAEQKLVESKYKAQQQADSIRNAARTDSLQRIARDSLDFKRKRYLLFLDVPDSLYGKPEPITPENLRERMLETIRLKSPGLAVSRPVAPADTSAPVSESSPKPKEKPLLRTFDKIK